MTDVKCLTVCQPYAQMICESVNGLPVKRVENRVWSTSYRGRLLIHAGKSREWIDSSNEVDESKLYFGGIIGECQLVDCIPIMQDRPRYEMFRARDMQKYQWLIDHPHASGPYGFVLDNAVIYDDPIPYCGRQRFFDVPLDIQDKATVGGKPVLHQYLAYYAIDPLRAIYQKVCHVSITDDDVLAVVRSQVETEPNRRLMSCKKIP